MTAAPARHDLADDLRDLVNVVEGEVRLGAHDRLLYATDASLYQVEPLAVVIPASAEDVQRAVQFCHERRIPMLPRAGGTSLAGQCVSHAVVIDTSARLRAVRDLDVQRRTVYAEAGVAIESLNKWLDAQRSDLFFAPDPATLRQACVGGVIGNNAAGARSILYGRTSENLESVDGLLADGRRVRFGADSDDVRDIAMQVAGVVRREAERIRARFPKTVRRNAGYGLDVLLQQLETGGDGALNLAHLLAGSEGTLAFTLGATLRLHRKPVAKGLAVLGFESLEAAIDSVQDILATKPSAVELVDDLVIDLARRNLEVRRYVDLLPRVGGADPTAALYVEYFADESAAELRDRFAALRAAVPHAAFEAHTDETSMQQAWRLRQSGEPLLHALPGDRKPITFIEDNAIPVERLPEFVRDLKAIIARRGTRAAFYAHASVGVLHVRPLLSVRDADDRRRMVEIATETAALARSLGGVMSGEHGDGRVRTPFLEGYYGPELMRAFREVKAIFDPHNLLNPGNIVEPAPVESIATTLRVDRERTPLPDADAVETYFDYDDHHGLHAALDACNGSGLCRKRESGTMCPSYMALADERHATRGRANALRLAITGQLTEDGLPAWNDSETVRTLDLCLSCKACKAECPTNVDVARLKSEYTAQRHKRTGVPMQVRVMTRVRALNRAGCLAPGLSNAAMRVPPLAALARSLMGVDRRRSLPHFARALRHRAAGPPDRPRVALFADCFTAFGESHIGRAAIDLLEHLGYGVELISAGCCARPAISLGALDIAQRQMARTAGALDGTGDVPLIVLEPSCLSALTDDWPALKSGAISVDARKAIAARAISLERFVESRWNDHPQPLAPAARAQTVLLHEHCHAKALEGAGCSAGALRRLVGDGLTVLDSGCCGMAGAFGYAPARFDLSTAIGERVLAPAVRKAPAEALIVAPGTSCRHQIVDLTGKRALHPAEALLRTIRAPAPE